MESSLHILLLFNCLKTLYRDLEKVTINILQQRKIFVLFYKS